MPAKISASEYVRSVRWEPASATLTYGKGLPKLRHAPAPLEREQYASFVRSMPIVCVDVLLQRQNGDMLSVQRHSEPAKGLYWYPGGRLRMGETFASEALRKVRNEIGLNNVCYRGILGTFNTVFERSAWGGPTQTVNVLVHATTDDALTTAGSIAAVLPICGDRRGVCDDGTHALYKWLPLETTSAEDRYILEGLRLLRATLLGGKGHLGAPCRNDDARNDSFALGTSAGGRSAKSIGSGLIGRANRTHGVRGGATQLHRLPPANDESSRREHAAALEVAARRKSTAPRL